MIAIVRTAAAKRDLLDKWETIALDSPMAADNVLRKLGERIEQLATQPRLGPRRSDIRAALRMLVQWPHLILYETKPDSDEAQIKQVEIVRIVDGRRDLTSLLGEN